MLHFTSQVQSSVKAPSLLIIQLMPTPHMSPLSLKARLRIFRATFAAVMMHAVGRVPSNIVKDEQKKLLVNLVKKYSRLSRERDFRYMLSYPFRKSAWIEIAWILNCTVEAVIKSWQEIVLCVQDKLIDDEFSVQKHLGKILLGKRSRKRTVSSLLAHSIASNEESNSSSNSFDTITDTGLRSSSRFTTDGAALNIKRSLSLELELIEQDLEYFTNNPP